MHDADSSSAVDVRVRVGLGCRSVRRPSGVADAHAVEGGSGPATEGAVERTNPSHGAHPDDVTGGGPNGDSDGVVAAILEPTEGDEEIVRRGRMRAAGDDAAHHPSARLKTVGEIRCATAVDLVDDASDGDLESGANWMSTPITIGGARTASVHGPSGPNSGSTTD